MKTELPETRRDELSLKQDYFLTIYQYNRKVTKMYWHILW